MFKQQTVKKLLKFNDQSDLLEIKNISIIMEGPNFLCRKERFNYHQLPRGRQACTYMPRAVEEMCPDHICDLQRIQ